MKRKIFAALLVLCALLLGLTACSRTAAAIVTVTPDTGNTLEASDSDAVAALANLPPASASDIQYDVQRYDTAQSYLGQPASALISAIGEPESAEYAASCEQAGAEDGMLHYKGFYVWTMRTATGEIVRAVYIDEDA